MCSKFTKRDLRCRIQSLPHTFFESARSLQKVVPVSGNLCASNGCCRALHSPKARLLPHENRSDATTKRKISQNLEKSAQALVRTVNAISYNSAQILSFCTLLRPKCARAEVLCFPGESQIPQATEKIRETDLSGMLRAKAQLTVEVDKSSKDFVPRLVANLLSIHRVQHITRGDWPWEVLLHLWFHITNHRRRRPC